MDVSRFTQYRDRVIENCSKVIVGKDDVIALVLRLNNELAGHTEQTFALIFVIDEATADFFDCYVGS